LQKKIEKPTIETVASQFNLAFGLNWHNIASQELVVDGPSGIRIDEAKAGGRFGISEGFLKTFSERFNHFDPPQRAMVAGLLTSRGDRQADIISGLGNYALNDDMAKKIPDSLQRLFEYDKKTTGLFTPIRKGQSAWISNLKNRGKGKADGIAYEVLAAAKMLHTPIKGRPISIGDRLDFGPKLQASYGGGGGINVTDGKSQSVFSQPFRKTVEADLLITQSPFEGGKEIAVDFKHTISKSAITTEQLEGVAVALKTGEVDEWHFVCNREFTPSVIVKVNEINKELESQNSPTIQLHQYYDWR
jgi:hypothetical protein